MSKNDQTLPKITKKENNKYKNDPNPTLHPSQNSSKIRQLNAKLQSAPHVDEATDLTSCQQNGPSKSATSQSTSFWRARAEEALTTDGFAYPTSRHLLTTTQPKRELFFLPQITLFFDVKPVLSPALGIQSGEHGWASNVAQAKQRRWLPSQTRN